MYYGIWEKVTIISNWLPTAYPLSEWLLHQLAFKGGWNMYKYLVTEICDLQPVNYTKTEAMYC